MTVHPPPQINLEAIKQTDKTEPLIPVYGSCSTLEDLCQRKALSEKFSRGTKTNIQTNIFKMRL